MSGSTFYRLGLLMARRRWVVVAVWAVLIVMSGGLASRFHDSLSTPSFSVTGSESERVTTLLDNEFTGTFTEQDLIVFESDTLTVADPAFQAVIQDATARIAEVEGVVAVISPLEPGAERQISADGQAAYALVGLQGTVDDRLDRVEDYLDAVAAAETDDVRVYFTGRSPISNALVTVASEDLQRAESIALPIALLILVLAFGSLVAAGIPLLSALAGIALTFRGADDRYRVHQLQPADRKRHDDDRPGARHRLHALHDHALP